MCYWIGQRGHRLRLFSLYVYVYVYYLFLFIFSMFIGFPCYIHAYVIFRHLSWVASSIGLCLSGSLPCHHFTLCYHPYFIMANKLLLYWPGFFRDSTNVPRVTERHSAKFDESENTNGARLSDRHTRQEDHPRNTPYNVTTIDCLRWLLSHEWLNKTLRYRRRAARRYTSGKVATSLEVIRNYTVQ